MFSLNDEAIAKLIDHAMPASQATDRESLNLGYGFIYYGLVRALRPRQVVVIGSKKGFSVLCMARALLDNCGHGIREISCYRTVQTSDDLGHLHFVDPSYSVERGDANHMYGIGFWDDAERVQGWWSSFSVERVVTHHKCRSEEFFKGHECPRELDLVLADGDHTPQGITLDIELAAERLRPGGMILVHDVHPECRLRGGEAIEDLDPQRFSAVRLPVYPGLGLVQKREKWTEFAEIDPR